MLPSRARTATTDSSRVNATSSSRIRGPSPSSAHAPAASPPPRPPSGLQHRRQPDRRDGAIQTGPVVDGRGPRDGDAEPFERRLLPAAVLGRLEGGGTGAERGEGLRGAGRVRRHALPLVGDDRGAGRHDPRRLGVVERPDAQVPDEAGRRGGRRIEEPELQTEGQPGEGEHASELTAAEHADDRPGAVHPRVLPHRRHRGDRPTTPEEAGRGDAVRYDARRDTGVAPA